MFDNHNHNNNPNNNMNNLIDIVDEQLINLNDTTRESVELLSTRLFFFYLINKII